MSHHKWLLVIALVCPVQMCSQGQPSAHVLFAGCYRVVSLAWQPPDEDIKLMGRYAAEIFDEIIIRHDDDGRGRSNEQITQLITEGIQSINSEIEIAVISDEVEALSYAMENAVKGSFIVVCSDAHRVLNQISKTVYHVLFVSFLA